MDDSLELWGCFLYGVCLQLFYMYTNGRFNFLLIVGMNWGVEGPDYGKGMAKDYYR